MTKKRRSDAIRDLSVCLNWGSLELRSALDKLLTTGTLHLEVTLDGCTATCDEEEFTSNSPKHYPQRLPVPMSRGGVAYLRIEALDWVEAASQYVRLHSGDDRVLMRESMNRIETWLDPDQFTRVHRSAIVNLAAVQMLRVDSPNHRWAILANGTAVRVSRNRWRGLEEAMIGLR